MWKLSLANAAWQNWLESGQKPFAIILNCSDSRSPAEIIFDQGVGDLFVVRVAGNVIAPSLLASMEFAAANFGSALILVMGHTKCGAIKEAIEHVQDPQREIPSTNLKVLIEKIRPPVEATLGKTSNKEDLLNLCTEANVHQSLKRILEESTIIRDLVNKEKLGLAGAILDIHTGKVTILDEIGPRRKESVSA